VTLRTASARVPRRELELWNDLGVQPQRRRIDLGVASRPCDLCGSEDVALTESRPVRRGLDRINPAWTRAIRRYELCRSCGAKQEAGLPG
jgi:hypothetical protein